MSRARTSWQLPAALAPIGLSLTEAATYIGVGQTLFLVMVNDGRMPRAKCANGRRIWSRAQLDKAFDELPDEDAAAPSAKCDNIFSNQAL